MSELRDFFFLLLSPVFFQLLQKETILSIFVPTYVLIHSIHFNFFFFFSGFLRQSHHIAQGQPELYSEALSQKKVAVVVGITIKKILKLLQIPHFRSP